MKTNDFPGVGDFTPACTSPLLALVGGRWEAAWWSGGQGGGTDNII